VEVTADINNNIQLNLLVNDLGYFKLNSLMKTVCSHGRIRICNVLNRLLYKFICLTPAVIVTIYFGMKHLFYDIELSPPPTS
jgi:hypothetical protein